MPAITLNGRPLKSTAVTAPDAKLRAESLRLLARALDQFRPENALGKSREIFNLAWSAPVARRLVTVQYKRLQIRARRVNGGGQARATAPDDDHLIHDFSTWRFDDDRARLDARSKESHCNIADQLQQNAAFALGVQGQDNAPAMIRL